MKKTLLLLGSLVLLLGCTKENDELSADEDLASWGYMQFYQATDLGLGSLSVYVNGTLEGQVTGVDADGPSSTDCTITGFSKKFEEGSYSYRVQNASGSKVWQGNIDVPNYGMCTAIRLIDSGGGTGGASTTGNVMFWTKNSTLGNITVKFGGVGEMQEITKYQLSGNPSGCGVSGFANYNKVAGTYSYTATNASGVQWSGNVNVPTNNGCFLQELTYSITGGGGGTSDNKIGHLTVWSKNATAGTITVTCGGQTRYITTKYSSAPNCEASGTAIFNLPYGTYTINASSSNGTTWNPYQIVINDSGQCFMVGLQ